MKKGFFLSLIICFCVACVYLFFAFYDAAEKTAIRQLNEEQRIHAEQAAQGIGDFFKTWTGMLNSFAKMDEIISLDQDGKRYLALFYEAHHEQITSITRVDETGRIMHTVPYGDVAGNDISDQKHMQEILRGHKPVVSDVFWAVQGFYGVALHVPVFKGDIFKGTIAVVIDFENLAKRYLEVIRIGKTGYAWVVGRDGTTLYSPVPGFTGKSVFENGKDFPSLISMAKDMLQGHKASATYTFDRIGDQTVARMKKYAVYQPVHIANSFWSIVVASSEEEVLSSLASFRNRLILIVGMMLLGGIIFSVIGVKAWMIVAEEKKRKSAEEELRQNQQYNRLLFELSPIGLALCRIDGTFVDINSAYAKIIGRSVQEALQLTYWDITPEKYAEQEKAQLQRLEKFGCYGPYEKEYIHKDGHLVSVRLQGLTFEKDGEKFIWSSVENISESKQAEAALRLSEEKFAKSFRNSPDAIALTSLPDGEFVEINESFLHLSGYRLDEVVGRTTSDLHLWVNPADRQRYLDLMQKPGRVTGMEVDFRKKSGEIMRSLVSGELIKVQGKAYILTIIFDITERKMIEVEREKHRENLEEQVRKRTAELQDSQTALLNIVEDLNQKTDELEEANAKLRELDRLKSMFIASMSHELRTPLNSIIGFSGIILQGMSGSVNEEQRDQLQRVFMAGKHLLSLITDVIDIAKIESGKITPYPEDFDLPALINEAVGQVRLQAEGKELAIEVRLPDQPVVMCSDRKRLLQCLLNYLSNAVKFSEKGAVLVVVAEAQFGKNELPEGWIEISVSDTGIGIRKEDMKLLFNSFVRLETPLKTMTPGTGLGLYLTRKLATEVLNGTVGAESEEGHGSRFWLRLPQRIEVT